MATTNAHSRCSMQERSAPFAKLYLLLHCSSCVRARSIWRT